jgi:hypothetical protein
VTPWLALLAITLFEGGDPAGYKRIPPPGVRYRMNMATATSSPWIDSNLWRYRRNPEVKYLSATKGKSVTLTTAEAAALRANVALEIAPEQKADYDRITAWLAKLPSGPTTPWTNFNVSDDGSAMAGEVQLLMARRNLLYKITPPKQAQFQLSSAIKNPYEYVLDTRDQFGDDKRVLRLFGSELTMAELAREGKRIRLHLINYGSRPVEALRIRIAGRFTEKQVKAHVFDDDAPELREFTFENGFTEFTLGKLPVYAVLDFEAR